MPLGTEPGNKRSHGAAFDAEDVQTSPAHKKARSEPWDDLPPDFDRKLVEKADEIEKGAAERKAEELRLRVQRSKQAALRRLRVRSAEQAGWSAAVSEQIADGRSKAFLRTPDGRFSGVETIKGQYKRNQVLVLDPRSAEPVMYVNPEAVRSLRQFASTMRHAGLDPQSASGPAMNGKNGIASRPLLEEVGSQRMKPPNYSRESDVTYPKYAWVTETGGLKRSGYAPLDQVAEDGKVKEGWTAIPEVHAAIEEDARQVRARAGRDGARSDGHEGHDVGASSQASSATIGRSSATPERDRTGEGHHRATSVPR